MLLAASFPKFGHPAFAWIALAPLIVATTLTGRTGPRQVRRQFLLGVTTGFVYFAGMLYWVVPVMARFGDLAAWLATIVGVLLWAYLAFYPGIFAMLVGLAVRRFGVNGIWFAPAFWVATEWVRSAIGGGFPWGLLGTSQAAVLPVVQLASVTGVYGLSALVALVATAAAAVTLGRGKSAWVGATIVGALLVLVAAAGTVRLMASPLTQTGRPLRVGLLQGSVEQVEKWDPAYQQMILQRYLDLSRKAVDAGAAIVIWPESSTPFYFDTEGALAQPVRQLAATSHTPFIIGTDEFQYGPPGKKEDRIYNTAVVVGGDGKTHGTYRKMRLVPFGEYVPLQRLLFFVAPLVEAVSDFSPGTEPVVLNADGTRVSVSICYESVYPWISRAFVERGSELLATITNDAWFGHSSAAYQHFAQGAIRAVEEGRYVVRSANTGISGAVDPYGRVLLATPLFQPLSATVDVRLLDGRTIYSRVGDVVAWAAIGITILVFVSAIGSGRRDQALGIRH